SSLFVLIIAVAPRQLPGFGSDLRFAAAPPAALTPMRSPTRPCLPEQAAIPFATHAKHRFACRSRIWHTAAPTITPLAAGALSRLSRRVRYALLQRKHSGWTWPIS